MAKIQLQLQNIFKLAEEANNQLAEIETTILQTSKVYKTQMAGDIFSISKDLWDIIQGDMENQVHHIKSLLADGLNRCKEKENMLVNSHIKEIQNTHQNSQ